MWANPSCSAGLGHRAAQSGISSCTISRQRRRQGHACADGPRHTGDVSPPTCAVRAMPPSGAGTSVVIIDSRTSTGAGTSTSCNVRSTGRIVSCTSNDGESTATTSGNVLEDRAVGAMLGAMCGNVLGAPVANDRHWMVTRRFPTGVTNFWPFDISEQPVPLGHYTGDFSLLLATARSVTAARGVYAAHVASEFLALELADPQQLAAEAEFGAIRARLREEAAAAAVAERALRRSKKVEPSKTDDSSKAGTSGVAAGASNKATGASNAAAGASNATAVASSAAAAAQLQRGAARSAILPEVAALAESLPVQRRYPPYAELLMDALLSRDTPLAAVPYLADKYLAEFTPRFSHIIGDRAEREPYGPDDLGGAVRILPIALAYRDAPPAVRGAAVTEALLFSHPGGVGLDAARVAAEALVWLSMETEPQPATGTGLDGGDLADGAVRLMDHLMTVAQTEEMKAKLDVLRSGIFQVAPVSSWRSFLRSRAWARLMRLLTDLSFHGYATAGPEGVCVALLPLLVSWGSPEDAVCIAATMGGSAPATSQLTGAFAGSLHGASWLPLRWTSDLENGHGGRDEVEALARQLAGLGCNATPGGPMPEALMASEEQLAGAA